MSRLHLSRARVFGFLMGLTLLAMALAGSAGSRWG
jgi:hypothetical protein